MLSVVIPTLNAAECLPAALAPLADELVSEIVVVDGASHLPPRAAAANLRVLHGPSGRGVQLAAGVAAARTDWLLLLHADTVLQPGWQAAVRHHMAGGTGRAGYFRFALASPDRRARRLERLVEWRCRTLALPYGDQGLLIHRGLLAAVGGVPALPLMEDVALIRRLGRRRIGCLDATAMTSARKWQQQGWMLRSLRNLTCLGLYFSGVPAAWIVRLYG